MLKLLSLLAGIAKFGWLAKWFAFIPGGQIIGIIGAVISGGAQLVVSFLRWLIADIEDAFKSPQRGLVRIICGLLILTGGVYLGVKWTKHKAEVARAELAGLKRDLKQKDDEDARLAEMAKAARQRAESEARRLPFVVVPAPALASPAAVAPAAAVPPAPAPVTAEPKRVRHRSAATAKDNKGSPLPAGLHPIPGFFDRN